MAPLLNSRMRELYARFSNNQPDENAEDESTQRSAPWPRAKHSRTCRGAFADDASFELQKRPVPSHLTVLWTTPSVLNNWTRPKLI